MKPRYPSAHISSRLRVGAGHSGGRTGYGAPSRRALDRSSSTGTAACPAHGDRRSPHDVSVPFCGREAVVSPYPIAVVGPLSTTCPAAPGPWPRIAVGVSCSLRVRQPVHPAVARGATGRAATTASLRPTRLLALRAPGSPAGGPAESARRLRGGVESAAPSSGASLRPSTALAVRGGGREFGGRPPSPLPLPCCSIAAASIFGAPHRRQDLLPPPWPRPLGLSFPRPRARIPVGRLRIPHQASRSPACIARTEPVRLGCGALDRPRWRPAAVATPSPPWSEPPRRDNPSSHTLRISSPPSVRPGKRGVSAPSANVVRPMPSRGRHGVCDPVVGRASAADGCRGFAATRRVEWSTTAAARWTGRVTIHLWLDRDCRGARRRRVRSRPRRSSRRVLDLHAARGGRPVSVWRWRGRLLPKPFALRWSYRPGAALVRRSRPAAPRARRRLSLYPTRGGLSRGRTCLSRMGHVLASSASPTRPSPPSTCWRGLGQKPTVHAPAGWRSELPASSATRRALTSGMGTGL